MGALCGGTPPETKMPMKEPMAKPKASAPAEKSVAPKSQSVNPPNPDPLPVKVIEKEEVVEKPKQPEAPKRKMKAEDLLDSMMDDMKVEQTPVKKDLKIKKSEDEKKAADERLSNILKARDQAINNEDERARLKAEGTSLSHVTANSLIKRRSTRNSDMKNDLLATAVGLTRSPSVKKVYQLNSTLNKANKLHSFLDLDDDIITKQVDDCNKSRKLRTRQALIQRIKDKKNKAQIIQNDDAAEGDEDDEDIEKVDEDDDNEMYWSQQPNEVYRIVMHKERREIQDYLVKDEMYDWLYEDELLVNYKRTISLDQCIPIDLDEEDE